MRKKDNKNIITSIILSFSICICFILIDKIGFHLFIPALDPPEWYEILEKRHFYYLTLFISFTVSMIYRSFFREEKYNKYCIQCKKVFKSFPDHQTECPNCNASLEVFNGVFQKHPELSNNIEINNQSDIIKKQYDSTSIDLIKAIGSLFYAFWSLLLPILIFILVLVGPIIFFIKIN